MHPLFNCRKPIYFITDSRLSRASVVDDVAEAVTAGVCAVQYREKNKTKGEMITEALQLKTICSGKALFLVNDYVDVALAVDADGVHLGEEDIHYTTARKQLGPKKIIGMTAHSITEALAAQEEGADYLGVGPVFATASKKNALQPKGIRLLKQVMARTHLPIVAIGGINETNIHEVMDVGVRHIAMIEGIYKNGNIKKNITILRKLMQP